MIKCFLLRFKLINLVNSLSIYTLCEVQFFIISLQFSLLRCEWSFRRCGMLVGGVCTSAFAVCKRNYTDDSRGTNIRNLGVRVCICLRVSCTHTTEMLLVQVRDVPWHLRGMVELRFVIIAW